VRAKVKTTVVDTGQEYLLLVAKMNLKGILVNTTQILKPNTQLLLELKLNEQDPIILKGYVHKISQEASSKKGMVIAFSNPSDENKRKIQRFIDDSKEISAEAKIDTDDTDKKKGKWSLRKKKESEEKKEAPAKPSAKKKSKAKPAPKEEAFEPNKTMIVGEDDLPSMKLSSPDNSKELAVATMDEESLHAKNPGLSGSTRHVKLDSNTKKKVDRKPFRMSTVYKAFGFVVFLIVAVLAAKPILNIMDTKFGKKFNLPTASTTTTAPTQGTQPAQQSSPSETTSSLDAVQSDDQGGFLKISLLGKGNFANNRISKVLDKNTVRIELPEVQASKAPLLTNINNNPISKVAASASSSGVVVDIIYTGKEPPNYEVKLFNGGMDIFVYR
jgi:hypothetical protein